MKALMHFRIQPHVKISERGPLLNKVSLKWEGNKDI